MKKFKLLIVDQNKDSIEILKSQLRPFNYEISEACDGETAIEKIETSAPDIILLDLVMPKISGYEVCRHVKYNPLTRFIPIIIITDVQEPEDKIKAIELGVDDFLVKPFNKLELSTRIKSLLKIKSMHDQLENSENILFSLAGALEAKDKHTRGHSERVATAGQNLAEAMNLPEETVKLIYKGGLLHDIGKIGVREDILLKAGSLTPEERRHVESHTSVGFDICFPLTSLGKLLPSIKSHHERYDGSGYPEGLKGNDIPLMGQILAIVDAYDAMTTDRSYRKGMSPDNAVAIFRNEINSGQWNPGIVKIFLSLIKVE